GGLVVDGPEPLRPLFGEDRLFALAADQHRFGPGDDLRLGPEVDGDVVHRDRADHRVALAADQDLGVVAEPAANSVPVADRKHSDPGVALRLPGAPVSRARAL